MEGAMKNKMNNKLFRDNVNILEFILASCVATAALCLTGLATINLGHYSLDGLLGWTMLMAFAGISTYKSALPGFLIAVVWGIVGGSELHSCINIMTVFLGMYSYQMLHHLRPMSPLNVYEAAMSGAVLHSVLTYTLAVHSRPESLILFILLELLITLFTFKAAVNKVRELGFINHEDPLLVAKIERDWLQETYNLINKKLHTNLHRPQRPNAKN